MSGRRTTLSRLPKRLRIAAAGLAVASGLAVIAAALPRCTQECSLSDHITKTAKMTENKSLSGVVRVGSLVQIKAFDDVGGLVTLEAPRLLMAECFPVDRVRHATTGAPQCVANSSFKLSSVVNNESVSSLEQKFRLKVAKPSHRVLADADLVPSSACVQVANKARLPASALRAVTEEFVAEELHLETGMETSVSSVLGELVRGLNLSSASYQKTAVPTGSGAATTVFAAADRDGLVLGYRLREVRLCFEADPSKCAGQQQ